MEYRGVLQEAKSSFARSFASVHKRQNREIIE